MEVNSEGFFDGFLLSCSTVDIWLVTSAHVYLFISGLGCYKCRPGSPLAEPAEVAACPVDPYFAL
jgi:hypothetical protein